MILHDFSCFIQKIEYFIIFKKIFMFYYIDFFSSFSCSIQVFHVLFEFLYSYINCGQKVHTIMNKSIQSLGLSAYKLRICAYK